MINEVPLIDKELKGNILSFRILAFFPKRIWGMKLLAFFGGLSKGKVIKGLVNEERYITTKNSDRELRVRIFRPVGVTEKLPAMLYYHGGGYFMGTPEMVPGILQKFMAKRPCVIIAPDYRKSLEAPYPASFDDCYDTLLWAKENATELNINDTKFILAGHSSGGGVTAGVAIKARDTQEVDIAFQMPIYPMIDDREDKEYNQDLPKIPEWSKTSGLNIWRTYLKDLIDNNQEIPPYAAPARNTDFKNLAPTITYIGDMEPFRDETIKYVESLREAGVDVRFKIFEGALHFFDHTVPKAGISKDAFEFSYGAFGEFYDKYAL